MVPALRTPGVGIVAIIASGPLNGQVLATGPMVSPAVIVSNSDPGTVTVAGATDNILLADRRVHSAATTLNPADATHDVRPGPARPRRSCASTRTSTLGARDRIRRRCLRSVCVRPGRDRLKGTVEVDENYVGGEEPGLRGGRQKGEKALVVITVEQRERGLGRTRMQRIPDAAADTLCGLLSDSVEPGSTVVTDGLVSYIRAASAAGCARQQIGGARSVEPDHLPTTSTSSSSASTGARPATAAYCSCGCSNSPSPTIPRTPNRPTRVCSATSRAAPANPPIGVQARRTGIRAAGSWSRCRPLGHGRG
jgi:transposase-like protein